MSEIEKEKEVQKEEKEVMTPPAKKLRVKMWAMKSKTENYTLEKTTKFFTFISGEAKACFVVSNSMKKVIRESRQLGGRQKGSRDQRTDTSTWLAEIL